MLVRVENTPHKVVQIRNERSQDSFFVRFEASVIAVEAVLVGSDVRSVGQAREVLGPGLSVADGTDDRKQA